MRRPSFRIPIGRFALATLAAALVAGCGFVPRIPGITP